MHFQTLKLVNEDGETYRELEIDATPEGMEIALQHIIEELDDAAYIIDVSPDIDASIDGYTGLRALEGEEGNRHRS